MDRPINPMAQLVSSGATFVARSHAAQVKHMNEMFERAILHNGFSVVETLSECTMFYPGSFDDSIPRKGGEFNLVEEEHNREDLAAAMELTNDLSPGKFGIYYEADRPTKNENEMTWVKDAQEAHAGLSDQDILRKSFARMK